ADHRLVDGVPRPERRTRRPPHQGPQLVEERVVTRHRTRSTLSGERALVLLDAERLLWTGAHGILDLGSQGLVGVLLEDVELVVVVDAEHLGREAFAHAVALTQ